MTLGIAADIAEIVNNASLDEDKQDEVMELVAAATAAFGNQVMDKSYMSGVSDTVDVLHNPNKAGSFVEKRLAALEPAALGELRRQVDPYMRYTHDLATEIRNRTPGLSETLPVARDMWGRPRDFQSGLGTVYDAVSPIASRAYKPEPIDREAIEHDFNLSMPIWTMPAGGVTVALRNRPEVYSRLLEIRGQVKPSDMGNTKEAVLVIRKYGDTPLLETLNAIVEGKHPLSAKYAAAAGGRSGGKDDMVSQIVSDYGRAARLKVIEEFPEVAGIVARKKEKTSK
jgi:hypothetical protein